MSKLFVVATPIGNLGDITHRAVEILREVDFVICEDTRVTGKLLNHLGIKKHMISLNAFDEKKSLDSLIFKIQEASKVALVSDAGTPTISDPGVRLVSLARQSNIEIEPIPGASALTTALSGSGMSVSSFLFLGFLPKKKGRKTIFEKIANTEEAVVFYESPHRIVKTLKDLNNLLCHPASPSDGPTTLRKIGVYKELTKIHEEFITGTCIEILQYLDQHKGKIKGEFVVIIEGIKRG